MTITKKHKLETWDAMNAELNKLRLAVFDLGCSSKWPFQYRVKVNCSKEIDGDYDEVYAVSVSDRSMPYYRVEAYGYDGKVQTVSFWTESEIAEKQGHPSIYWRMMRHAIWKIGRHRADLQLEAKAIKQAGRVRLDTLLTLIRVGVFVACVWAVVRVGGAL